jgi:hypothetical protein
LGFFEAMASSLLLMVVFLPFIELTPSSDGQQKVMLGALNNWSAALYEDS